MGMPQEMKESRVGVLVDCDNVPPGILEHSLRFAAQFGRVVVRRGYGNPATLNHRWQEKLVQQAFTPCLQFQYASGKNTADIALALDALELLFDEKVDTFCLVTSDSDFAYLCRKLRERGSMVSIVGEAKTPQALRNASDHFSEWSVSNDGDIPDSDSVELPEHAAATAASPSTEPNSAKPPPKRRPRFVVDAVVLMTGDTSEGRVDLGSLGHYLRRTDPSFSPKSYGHSGLLDMLRTYDLLRLEQAVGGHWRVSLAKPLAEPA